MSINDSMFLFQTKIERIVADIPPFIYGRNFKLKMEITVRNGDLYLIFIKGCNPYKSGNRYEFKLQRNDSIGHFDSRQYLHTEEGSTDLPCMHGGLPHNRSCLCPPGFTGQSCETGCGRNKFGPRCDFQCSEYSRQCRGTILCKSLLGCYCAPGWKGYHCETRCSDHEYGVGCRESCGHCAKNEPCDIYTGKCTKGCQPGFLPPLCQSKIVHLDGRIRVISESYNSAVISFDFIPLGGEGVPKYYQVQYREKFNQNWTSSNLRPIQDLDTNANETIANLISGLVYEARILLFDDKLNSYQGDELPRVTFVTKCTVNPLNITAVDVHTNYLVLTFEGTSTEDTRCQYSSYEVSITGGFEWKSVSVNEPRARFDDLLPATTYWVRARQRGNITLPFFSASFTTLPDIVGTVDDLAVTSVGVRSVALKWEAWEGSSESKFAITYKCLEILLYPNLNCSENTEPTPFLTTSNEINIEGLRPFTRYSFQVQQLPGNYCSEITATTDFFVDNPNIEIVNTFTNETIDVEWKMDCPLCQLYSDGYLLILKEDDNNAEPVVLFPHIYTNVTTQSFSDLKPGTNYNVLVYIVSKSTVLSNPVTANVSTKPSVPSAVGDLTAYRVSRNGAGLRCSAPDLLYGTLEDFRIDLDGNRNVQRPSKCLAWPQLYCFNLTGLRPDTTYNVSVSARNNVIEQFGDANYVSFRTVERAPEIPTNLRISNVRETSTTVTWGPPNNFNGIIRSFLIKIDQTESINSSECCEYYPKIDIPVRSEQPDYENEINGLIPGSRYALSLMAETVWLGPPASISFCTRPRAPESVPLPASTIFDFSTDSSATLDWAEADPSILQHEDSQPPYVHNFLILELSNDNQNFLTTSDNDLDEVLRSSLGGRLVLIAEYEKGDELIINPNTGCSKVGDSGLVLKCPDLEPGQRYRVAAASVARYCSLHSIKAVWSLPFTVPTN